MISNARRNRIYERIILATIGLLALTALFSQAQAEDAENGKISLIVTYEGSEDLRYKVWNKEQYDLEMSDAESEGNESSPSVSSGIVRENIRKGMHSCEITGLRPGTYMVYVFADKNGNGYLDEGPCGPSEPWGMSGLKKKPLLRAPRFDEVSFPFTEKKSITMEVVVK